MSASRTGGSWEDLARKWAREGKPHPVNTESTEARVQTIFGPRGEVLAQRSDRQIGFKFDRSEWKH